MSQDAACGCAAQTWVSSLTGNGDSNFTAGVLTAHSILAASQAAGIGSPCVSVLLFITDGRPSDGNASVSVLTALNSERSCCCCYCLLWFFVFWLDSVLF
jgi:Mg-chelatase subunit ChlD